jgi:NTP pyrophosphatase (non-canonical NTP hydrolase)
MEGNIMILKNNPPSESELEILNLITEESAEVIQAISKIQRFGYDACHPSDEDEIDNRTLLETEVGDLMCLLSIAVALGMVDSDKIITAMDNKVDKLQKYSNIFSKELPEEKSLSDELEVANEFINDAFTAHPNLDIDVANVRSML